MSDTTQHIPDLKQDRRSQYGDGDSPGFMERRDDGERRGQCGGNKNEDLEA